MPTSGRVVTQYALDALSDDTSAGTGYGGNMVARVTAVVNARPTQEWTSEQVHLALQDSKLPSVRAALSKAVHLKQIRKLNRNRFVSLTGESAATAERKEGSTDIAA